MAQCLECAVIRLAVSPHTLILTQHSYTLPDIKGRGQREGMRLFETAAGGTGIEGKDSVRAEIEEEDNQVG